MGNNSASLYNRYKDKLQRIADIKYAAAVLQWDQETYLPSKGNEARARQLATLNETAHQLFSEDEFGKLLDELSVADNLDTKQKRNVELTFEDYHKQKKYTGAFVRKMSETVSRSFYSWIDARKQNDFKIFEPALDELIQLKKQESDLLGYEDHSYNAHLKEYEKSTSVKQLDQLFENLQAPLKKLISEFSSKETNTDFLKRFYPKDQQWKWAMYLVKELGFDLEAGRQDISEHPFTTNFSARDVRITTRIDEHDFANMTWSCIHEVGHGLYEQGLPDEEYGLPSGEYASLSIHESQSRLWENCIGRGPHFWQFYFLKLQSFFPDQLHDVNLEQFLGAINKVQPSLIRTEADQLSYHFHVYVRYIIEKEIIGGNLKTTDIPARWNDLYEQFLGIKVPDDKKGCLQDVHWSHGSFGYFPTYSLGSLYAAQFWFQLQKDEPGVKEEIVNGNLYTVHQWLANSVYQHGRIYTSGDLCKRITGETLNTHFFTDYIADTYKHF
ncbi:MAG: thermostable carboxypeptidase 1 [Chitinophagaceae bacterium]|nr:thermostable carboxypeptidase 1 [Chitinophagaceae bacterium]